MQPVCLNSIADTSSSRTSTSRLLFFQHQSSCVMLTGKAHNTNRHVGIEHTTSPNTPEKSSNKFIDFFLNCVYIYVNKYFIYTHRHTHTYIHSLDRYIHTHPLNEGKSFSQHTCPNCASFSQIDLAIDATGHNAIQKQLKANECAELKTLPRRLFLCTWRKQICVSLLSPAVMSLGKMAMSRAADSCLKWMNNLDLFPAVFTQRVKKTSLVQQHESPRDSYWEWNNLKVKSPLGISIFKGTLIATLNFE